jgi:hypothetical protein
MIKNNLKILDQVQKKTLKNLDTILCLIENEPFAVLPAV